MDYNDLPPFFRVVETRSFTRAAELLGTQKSSISRSIKRLESELGVRLLQRTTRQLALTDAGQAFYEHARGALTGLDEAAAAVREQGVTPSGLIRLTLPTEAAEFGIAEAVNAFVQKYPAVQIEVSLTARLVDLVSEGFDLALRIGELGDSSLVAKRVGSTDMALLASQSYLERRGLPRDVADLAHHDCVLFRPRHGKKTWTLFGPSGETSVEVTGRVQADQLSFVLHACLAGAGIALLPPFLLRQSAQRFELEEVLPEHYAKGGPIHLVMPSARFVPMRVALLRDHLAEHLIRFTSELRRACSEHRARRGIGMP